MKNNRKKYEGPTVLFVSLNPFPTNDNELEEAVKNAVRAEKPTLCRADVPTEKRHTLTLPTNKNNRLLNLRTVPRKN